MLSECAYLKYHRLQTEERALAAHMTYQTQNITVQITQITACYMSTFINTKLDLAMLQFI